MNTKQLISLAQFLHSHNLSESEIRDKVYLESLIDNFKEDYDISLIKDYKVEEIERRPSYYHDIREEILTISHPTKGLFVVTVFGKYDSRTGEGIDIHYSFLEETGDLVEDKEVLEELKLFVESRRKDY